MAYFLATLFILICLLLIGIVLLQKGRGGGLAGAFGGAGGHSAFGSRTGDMFTWVTVILVGAFLLLGVAAVKYFRPDDVAQQVEEQTPALPGMPGGEIAPPLVENPAGATDTDESATQPQSEPAVTPATPGLEVPPELPQGPADQAPDAAAPATDAPVTEAPATETPATEVPATETPASEAPATEVPATEVPATETPATDVPAEQPTLVEPTTEPTNPTEPVQP